MNGTRGITAAPFTAALLAFLLPFGTVSCGEPVSFTGLELATGRVEGPDASLVDDVNGSLAPGLALGAAVAALVGLVLALLARQGQGRAALAALVGLTMLPWLAVLQPLGGPDLRVRSGYVLATGALVLVVGIRARLVLLRWLDAGRPTGWPFAGIVLLALLLFVTGLVCLDASMSFEAG